MDLSLEHSRLRGHCRPRWPTTWCRSCAGATGTQSPAPTVSPARADHAAVLFA